MMEFSIGQVVVWLIVGLIAGSVTGMIVKRSKEGFGTFYNLVIGLVGALIGGFLFKFVPFDFGMQDVAISLRDVVAACVGAFIFLGVVNVLHRRLR